MSKNINVNPGHYTNAGRERQGEDIVHDAERQKFDQQKRAEQRWQDRERQRGHSSAAGPSSRPPGQDNAGAATVPPSGFDARDDEPAAERRVAREDQRQGDRRRRS
jgi:hypothetical protein